jgi:hypothetical protein
MTGTGRASCRLAPDGLWYACHFEQEQHLADGTFVLTWRFHWVAGWDGRAAEYRASSVDSQGPNLGSTAVGSRETGSSTSRSRRAYRASG